MGPGGIAAVIAAVSLLIISVAIAYAIFRVGRLIDEVQESVRSVNKITHTAEEITAKISKGVNTVFDKNANLVKLLTGVATTLINRKRGSKDSE